MSSIHQLAAVVLLGLREKQRRRQVRPDAHAGRRRVADGVVDVAAEGLAALVAVEQRRKDPRAAAPPTRRAGAAAACDDQLLADLAAHRVVLRRAAGCPSPAPTGGPAVPLPSTQSAWSSRRRTCAVCSGVRTPGTVQDHDGLRTRPSRSPAPNASCRGCSGPPLLLTLRTYVSLVRLFTFSRRREVGVDRVLGQPVDHANTTGSRMVLAALT